LGRSYRLHKTRHKKFKEVMSTLSPTEKMEAIDRKYKIILRDEPDEEGGACSCIEYRNAAGGGIQGDNRTSS
jgi:hypothetical protein